MTFKKRFILFIIVFNLLSLAISGSIPDSLESALKRATSDIEKVMVYSRYAQDLVSSRQDESCQQALQCAQQ